MIVKHRVFKTWVHQARVTKQLTERTYKRIMFSRLWRRLSIPKPNTRLLPRSFLLEDSSECSDQEVSLSSRSEQELTMTNPTIILEPLDERHGFLLTEKLNISSSLADDSSSQLTSTFNPHLSELLKKAFNAL